jgi:hypothetical protein
LSHISIDAKRYKKIDKEYKRNEERFKEEIEIRKILGILGNLYAE